MSKPTLGRGLSDLLGTRRGATPATATPPRVDGGLRILIEGAAREKSSVISAPGLNAHKPLAARTSAPKDTDAAGIRMLAVAALAGADVALLGWTGWFTSAHEHALGFLSASLCTLSVLTAALCGCGALLLMRSRE